MEVINEYCLKGDERADDMLVRLHAGFLHPMIHLGFGVEFKQPAIIAEALAQAAVHDSWIGPFMLDTEKAAASSGIEGKPMVELIDEVRADEQLSSAARWNDSNKIRDGILVRAPSEMIRIAAKWKVMPDAIIEKTAEMTNVGYVSRAVPGLRSGFRPDLRKDLLTRNSFRRLSTILEEPSIHQSRLNLTFTICTASTAQSSMTRFSKRLLG